MKMILEVIAFLYIVGCSYACEPGWTPYQDVCFFFSDNQVTWAEAVELCKAFDGKLAEPETADVDLFIGKIATRNQRKYWLGGNDIIQEGTWVWLSTHESMTYNHWHAPDPNNAGHGEDCLLSNWFNTGQWADGDCEWHEYFICEMLNDDVTNGLIG